MISSMLNVGDRNRADNLPVIMALNSFGTIIALSRETSARRQIQFVERAYGANRGVARHNCSGQSSRTNRPFVGAILEGLRESDNIPIFELDTKSDTRYRSGVRDTCSRTVTDIT